MSPRGSYIEFVDVSRSFGVTRAVREVTMDLATSGRIHALVGENGAGKSTCLGMAAGRIAPSSGKILVCGVAIPAGSPRAARAEGVHAIYQELTILPALTPQANVFLGQTISRRGWLQEKTMRASYEALCERFGVIPAPNARCGDLSVAEQQTLEILRALASDARCILLDEPTASLAQAERDALFATMQGLRQSGIALTIVSHNLDEVLASADEITVFRDGQVVEKRPAADWNKQQMVRAMLGPSRMLAAASGEHTLRRPNPSQRDAPPVLRVRDLTSPGLITDVSFDLRPGEVLGIAGLVGSGRSSILRALAGLDRKATGSMATRDERTGSIPKSVREARRRGIALLPEDRKGQGLLLGRSGTDNVTLGEWASLKRGVFLSDARQAVAAANAAEQAGFDRRRLAEPVHQLSGGNQQKLMIARWLHTSHSVLLADEPTRGVDIGAKAEILRALEVIVRSGRSMILVSSELEEVVGLSDRVIVVNSGRQLATLDAADGPVTPARILQIIFDATDVVDVPDSVQPVGTEEL
jgi:ABC-type sugar transport system ATPase subunit